MNEPVRTERSFGVTAQLQPLQRRNLFNLRNSEIYPDLLDVMEMVCIEHEAALINTDAADSEAVLANHKMAKAAWQLFIHIQEKIDDEIRLFQASIAPLPPVPQLTSEEQWIEHVLDPTKPPPDDLYGAN